MALPPIPTTRADFPSLADCCLEAFSRIQLRPPAITLEHMFEARQSCIFLNSELTASRGVNLWEVKLGTLSLVAGTPTYTLTPDVAFLLDSYLAVSVGGVETDTFIYQLGRSDYSAIPNKAQQGKPSQVWFNRQITPEVSFYLNPDNNGPYTWSYYYQSQIADAKVAMGYAPDIPFRGLEAYTAKLAARLARKFRPEQFGDLKAEAEEMWKLFAGSDRENTPLTIAPDFGMYMRRR